MQLLASSLRRSSGMKEIKVALNMESAVEECKRGDVRMLIIDEIALIKPIQYDSEWLRSVGSSAHVIILSNASNLKTDDDFRPIAVSTISKHQSFEDLARVIMSKLPWNSKNLELPLRTHPQDILSNRQLEIFLLIGEGLTSRRISQRLGISIQTVGAHRKQIADKLGTVGNELSQAAAAYYWKQKAAEPASNISTFTLSPANEQSSKLNRAAVP